MKPLKNRWGSVKPYTRHASDCKHLLDPNYSNCHCPKWLYVNKRGENPRRYSLETPSWPEALAEATRVLEGFNPEIAAARKEAAERQQNSQTVLEAINLWLNRTRAAFGEDAQIVDQYRSTFGWVDKDGNPRGTLLKFVADHNAEHPDAQIITIDQMTPLICQQLLDNRFNAFNPYSRRQRWGTVRSFFKFLFERGVIPTNPVFTIKAPKDTSGYANVPYTPQQYSSLLEQADWYVDERVKNGEREVYCRRMHAFLELLRHTGMDLIDAAHFRPTQAIKYEWLEDESVPVLRYMRIKTKVEAVVPLTENQAKKFLNIPTVEQSAPEMPFRYKGSLVRSDVHNWGRRIANLLKLANITEVQLIGRDGRPAVDSYGEPITKPPNVKMLRHTAAVGWLSAGIREETVAKMLGHKSTEMIRKHYAPWCKQRETAHIREVLSAQNSTRSRKSVKNRRHKPELPPAV